MPAYSGLWNGEHNENYALQVNKTSLRKRASLLLRQRGLKAFGELITTLLADSTPASTAQVQRTRVVAKQGLTNLLGGQVEIETYNVLNRAVTAGDVTDINSVINETRAPSSYPTDLSGNSGGGKEGF